MPSEPNVLNYHIGRATVQWTPSGGSPRDLGNCVSGQLTPNIEFLDHFSSRAGIRSKDRSVVLETGGTVSLTLDEITPENLSMLLFGGDGSTVTTNTAGKKVFDVLSVSEVKGELVITGTNQVGNKFTATLNTVSFQPDGSFDMISEEWNQIVLSGEILDEGSGFGTIEETEVAA